MGRSGRAARLTLAGQVVKIGVMFVNLLLLSRLLDPEDFGVVAIGFAVIGFAELLRDFGLSAAVIQATDVSDAEQSNLFWINLLLGIVFAVAAFALAWPIEHLIGAPALASIIAGLGMVFMINGAQTQFQARLARGYRFGILSVTDILAQVGGVAVGVVCAAKGLGPWSLVAQQLVTATILLATRSLAAQWHPSRPRRDVPVHRFIRFGIHLGLSQVLGYAATQIPVIMMGARLGTYDTGLYNRASQLTSLPMNQIFGPLTNVALATLAPLKGTSRYPVSVRQVLAITALAGLVIYAPMAALADPLVEVLLGPGWTGVPELLVLLAAGSLFQSFTFPAFWVFLASGQTQSLLRYNLVSKSLLFASTSGGLLLGDAEGMAAGYAAGLALSWPLCAWWVSRIESVSLGEQLARGGKYTAIGLLSASAVSALISFVDAPPGLAIVAGTLAWGSLCVCLLLAAGCRHDVVGLLGLIRRARSS